MLRHNQVLCGALLFLSVASSVCIASPHHNSPTIKNIVFDLTGVLCVKTSKGQRLMNHKMINLVKQFKQGGMHVFVLSNMPKNKAEELVATNSVFNVFDGIMFSYQVHVKKPDVRIFNLFCETYNLKPETCLFIDDSVQNVAAAEKLGMHSVRFCGYAALITAFKTQRIALHC